MDNDKSRVGKKADYRVKSFLAAMVGVKKAYVFRTQKTVRNLRKAKKISEKFLPEGISESEKEQKLAEHNKSISKFEKQIEKLNEISKGDLRTVALYVITKDCEMKVDKLKKYFEKAVPDYEEKLETMEKETGEKSNIKWFYSLIKPTKPLQSSLETIKEIVGKVENVKDRTKSKRKMKKERAMTRKLYGIPKEGAEDDMDIEDDEDDDEDGLDQIAFDFGSEDDELNSQDGSLPDIADEDEDIFVEADEQPEQKSKQSKAKQAKAEVTEEEVNNGDVTNFKDKVKKSHEQKKQNKGKAGDEDSKKPTKSVIPKTRERHVKKPKEPKEPKENANPEGETKKVQEPTKKKKKYDNPFNIALKAAQNAPRTPFRGNPRSFDGPKPFNKPSQQSDRPAPAGGRAAPFGDRPKFNKPGRPDFTYQKADRPPQREFTPRPSFKAKDQTDQFHPSWQAKLQEKSKDFIAPFQGKKIKL